MKENLAFRRSVLVSSIDRMVVDDSKAEQQHSKDDSYALTSLNDFEIILKADPIVVDAVLEKMNPLSETALEAEESTVAVPKETQATMQGSTEDANDSKMKKAFLAAASERKKQKEVGK